MRVDSWEPADFADALAPTGSELVQFGRVCGSRQHTLGFLKRLHVPHCHFQNIRLLQFGMSSRL